MVWLLALLLAAGPADSVSVPAGPFQIGDATLPDCPPTTVELSAYRIDRTEVSIGEFERFAGSAAWGNDALWSPEGRAWRAENPTGAGTTARAAGRSPDHPVVSVTFWEAEAYCASTGGRLPSEAQWERAACGANPHPAAPDANSGVRIFNEGKHADLTGVHTKSTTAFTSPANVLGLYDTYGNVWEWTLDAYHAEGYAQLKGPDPVATLPTPWRTLRGGSYMNLPSYADCSHREPARPAEPRLTAGFRCVYTP